jgi:hypothetical protein
MSDLVKRLIAGDPELTAEELEIASAELDRVLEQRDRKERALASGRAMGAQLSREWGEQVRAVWRAEAIEVLKEQPACSLKALALEVWTRCKEKGVTKRNGDVHDSDTIYNFLSAQREQIAEILICSTRQASVMEQSPAEVR